MLKFNAKMQWSKDAELFSASPRLCDSALDFKLYPITTHEGKRAVWRFSVLLLVLLLTACGGKKDSFDEGHEWIFPRRAAEIHLAVVDAEGAPIPHPLLRLYVNGDPYESDGGFIGYDPAAGVLGDAAGEIVVHYLGEEGGGYEIPMNSPGPPRHRLRIEAPGYVPATLDLDALVFVSKYRTGETTLELAGESVEMIVVADRVVLEQE